MFWQFFWKNDSCEKKSTFGSDEWIYFHPPEFPRILKKNRRKPEMCSSFRFHSWQDLYKLIEPSKIQSPPLKWQIGTGGVGCT